MTNTTFRLNDREVEKFDLAQDLIGDVIAIKSGQIAEEEKKTYPNQTIINSLKFERKEAAKERQNLWGKDNNYIELIIENYSKRIEEHRKGLLYAKVSA